jgi:hypothetical protein
MGYFEEFNILPMEFNGEEVTLILFLYTILSNISTCPLIYGIVTFIPFYPHFLSTRFPTRL